MLLFAWSTNDVRACAPTWVFCASCDAGNRVPIFFTCVRSLTRNLTRNLTPSTRFEHGFYRRDHGLPMEMPAIPATQSQGRCISPGGGKPTPRRLSQRVQYTLPLPRSILTSAVSNSVMLRLTHVNKGARVVRDCYRRSSNKSRLVGGSLFGRTPATRPWDFIEGRIGTYSRGRNTRVKELNFPTRLCLNYLRVALYKVDCYSENKHRLIACNVARDGKIPGMLSCTAANARRTLTLVALLCATARCKCCLEFLSGQLG